MKVFIMSSSYIENTIAWEISHLLGVKVDTIFFLEENHTRNEIDWLYKDHQNIQLFSNYKEAILQSDFVIIINTGDILIKIINECIMYAKDNNINICVIEDQPLSDNIDKPVIFDKNIAYSEKPVILLFTVGEYCQTYCVEMTLNKLFYENKINFRQEFSTWTEKIIKKIGHIGFFNSKLLYHETKVPYDIIIKTLNGNMILDIENHLDSAFLPHQFKPNYVIIICERFFASHETITNIFRYRYLRNINKIIYSKYVSGPKKLEQEFPILCFSQDEINDHIQIDDELLDKVKETLFEDIISKIAISNEIQIINKKQ